MSQHGIDTKILEYFKDFKGYYIEAGASNPLDQNNTYSLEMSGWSGLLIEPNTFMNENYKRLRPNSIVENYALVSKNYKSDTIKAYSSTSELMYHIPNFWNETDTVTWPTSTLDDILKKHNLDEIDVFCLDVEGYEHEVLEGIDFERVRFGMIIIELHYFEGYSEDFSYLEKWGYTNLGKLCNSNHLFFVSNTPLTTTDRTRLVSNL